MAHPFSNRPDWEGLTHEPFAFGTGAPLSPEMRARLVEYARSIDASNVGAGSIWDMLTGRHRALLDDLAADRDEAFATLESRLYATPLTHGFLQGDEVHASVSTNPEARLFCGRLILDRLFRLAEATGARRVSSAEHGQTTIAVADLDGTLKQIEERIGVDLAAPRQAGELFGLRLRDGVYGDRHFDGIYAAWRALTIAREFGYSDPAILEIGGGSGHLAYFARLMGCRRFTIVDLPPVLIPQYVLLATAFGADEVGLDRPSSRGLRLLRADRPEGRSFSDIDLIVNVDSMPEMPPAAVHAYLDAVRPGGLLLSINQESAVENGPDRQNVVADLAAAHGFRRRYRMPAWLRTGWVEELYQAPASARISGARRLRDWLRPRT